MAFIDQESSVDGGRPILFYAFTLGSVVWRYTSAEDELTLSGNVYKPAAIDHDAIKQTGETVNDALRITSPAWIGPAQVYMAGAPSRAIQLTIFSKHFSDPEAVIVYMGEVSQINFPMPGKATITCETLTSTMKREGLRMAWQRSCPYALYDTVTCKVSKAAFGVNFTVLGIDGLTLTVELASARASEFFNNGFLEWSHPLRGAEYLAIDSHALTAGVVTLVLLSYPGDLFVGATGTVYPGCNFTPTNCQTFGNYDNYGGVPDLPGKSPFDGLEGGSAFT